MIDKILAVVAHPDDLEIMAGGSVIKWLGEGKEVHVLVLTTGSWYSPDGTLNRPKEEINEDLNRVKRKVGYTSYEVLSEETLNLEYKDMLVCEVLKRISSYQIDTVLTTWERDMHRDHRIASEIAVAACRRVPNLLMGQINHYMSDFYTPNYFVDITDSWERKLESVACFESQWERNKEDWISFMDATATYYGKVVGVDRAEGFIAKKILY